MKWITRGGKKMELSEMTDDHLLNALRYTQKIQAEYETSVKFFHHPVLGPRGEYATEAAENELTEMAMHSAEASIAEEHLAKEVERRGLTPHPKPGVRKLPEFELVEEMEFGTLYKLKEKEDKKEEEKLTMDNFEFYVAGVKFHRWRDCIDEIEEGETFSMEPEPENKYDPCAVKILYPSQKLNHPVMLGYVPSKISPQVSAFLATADAPVCEAIKVTPEQDTWKMLKVRIYDVGREEGQGNA